MEIIRAFLKVAGVNCMVLVVAGDLLAKTMIVNGL
jgi:hypothetical protein